MRIHTAAVHRECTCFLARASLYSREKMTSRRTRATETSVFTLRATARLNYLLSCSSATVHATCTSIDMTAIEKAEWRRDFPARSFRIRDVDAKTFRPENVQETLNNTAIIVAASLRSLGKREIPT